MSFARPLPTKLRALSVYFTMAPASFRNLLRPRGEVLDGLQGGGRGETEAGEGGGDGVAAADLARALLGVAGFGDDVAGVLDVVIIIALAAGHDVGAGPADEPVVADEPFQDVALGGADDHVVEGVAGQMHAEARLAEERKGAAGDEVLDRREARIGGVAEAVMVRDRAGPTSSGATSTRACSTGRASRS